MTFIAALRCDRIDAPFVIDGPINGESFAAYVEQMLVPTLKARRHRRPRQSRLPQGSRRPPHHPRGWRASVSSCRPIAPISIRSSRSSRSSNIECATPQSGPSKTLGAASARSSKRSRQTSAQTTSETQAMRPYNDAARSNRQEALQARRRRACQRNWMRFAGTRLQVLVDARNILNSCRNRGKAGSSSRIR